MKYTKSLLGGGVFEIEELDNRLGVLMFSVVGKDCAELFKHEPGGHRWQEYSGNRVHTSTITIVVLEPKKKLSISLDQKDLRWSFQRGSGKGGQHRNKTDTCVQLTHIPTKLSVRIDGRSQTTNKEKALEILTARVEQLYKDREYKKRYSVKKEQAGSGQRGDKVRTIRVRDGIVTHHSTGSKTTYKKYFSGDFSELF